MWRRRGKFSASDTQPERLKMQQNVVHAGEREQGRLSRAMMCWRLSTSTFSAHWSSSVTMSTLLL